jgi:hypothetical protein
MFMRWLSTVRQSPRRRWGNDFFYYGISIMVGLAISTVSFEQQPVTQHKNLGSYLNRMLSKMDGISSQLHHWEVRDLAQ